MRSPTDLLYKYQRAWYEDRARFKIGCWSRQIGKDFTSQAEAVVDCMRTPGTTWLVGAPSERQALESLEKAKNWTEAFEFAIADYTEDRDAPGALIKAAVITFPNKSRIIGVPGRPETVRGYSANALLTEFAFYDDPEATWRAIYPSISNPLTGGEKKMRLISTPNGKSGRGKRFYEILRDNLLEPDPERKTHWSCHLVTIHDAVADGLPIDIDELREAMGDPEGWLQEMECQFLDASNVLLPYDLIAGAESAQATEFADPAIFAPGTNKQLFIGIDFGRQNDPTVAWTIERVGDVLWTREVLVLRKMDTADQLEILNSRVAAARRACWDYTGPGIGGGDLLARTHGEYKPTGHHFGKVELCTFTTQFKRDLFPKLRRAFESPVKIRVPISVDVREDLHAMAQIVKNGQYYYEAPRTAAGHSDRCTAAALAIRAAETETGTYSMALI